MAPRDPLKVVIVGDDPLARSGISRLLSAATGLVVVAEYPSHTALAELDADVVIRDWTGSRSRVVSSGEAGAAPPTLSLVATEAEAAEALDGGSRAVLARSVEGELLEHAIRAVLAGGIVLDPSVATLPSIRTGNVDGGEELTLREREVLGWLAEGLSNKLIAARLDVSENTVKFHVNSILFKLGASSRTEAVVRAARLGLLVL